MKQLNPYQRYSRLRLCGYRVTDICKALGVSRWSYYKSLKRATCVNRGKGHIETDLVDKIKVLCGQLPSYGYRRIRILLRRCFNVVISGKRLLGLMRVEGLLVRVKRYLAHRKRVYGRIEVTRPNELWQMNMTKVWCGRSGWGYLVTVVDCFDRSVVGKRLSLRCGTEDALERLEEAIGRRFPEGVKGKGLVLRTDNGCQFTSRRFVLALKSLGITHSRTGYNNPEGNAMVERFYRTLKEEEVWLKEYQDICEATAAIYRFINFYNNDRIHSSLGWLSPAQYLKKWETSLSKLVVSEANLIAA